MENPNKIDEIFRQRLHGAEVPPPPFVWPAVEYELRKRRNRWLLWFLVFGVLAASAGIWQLRLWNKEQPTLVLAPAVGKPETTEPTGGTSMKEETAKSKPTKTTAEKSPSNTLPKAPVAASVEGKKSTLGTQKNVAKGVMQIPGSNGATVENPDAPEFRKPYLDKLQPALPIINAVSVFSIFEPENPISPKSFKTPSRRKKPQPKFCYDFARHPSAWLVDVYAGPSLAQRSLTSRLDDEPYLNQRLATERRDVAMNAGIRASLMFNRNFLVRTGLHYDRVTEIFEYIDPTYVKISVNQIFLNGQFIRTDTVVEYGENYQKTYNRYSMIDIPFILGVEMRSGRSGFSINAGVSANVIFQKRGVIIDPITQEPARFGPIPEKPKNIGPNATLSQPAFRSNVGLSATASIQWYWHITPQMRLFVEPSFRQALRPVSLSSHPVEQRYSILGLRLGATKIF